MNKQQVLLSDDWGLLDIRGLIFDDTPGNSSR